MADGKVNLGEIPCKVYDVETKKVIHTSESISQCAKELGVEVNWVRSAVKTSPDPFMLVKGRKVKRRPVKHPTFFSPTLGVEVTVRITSEHAKKTTT